MIRRKLGQMKRRRLARVRLTCSLPGGRTLISLKAVDSQSVGFRAREGLVLKIKLPDDRC